MGLPIRARAGTASGLGSRTGARLGLRFAAAFLLLLARGCLGGHAVGVDLGRGRSEFEAVRIEERGGLAHECLDVVELGDIIGGHECQGPALLTRAPVRPMRWM